MICAFGLHNVIVITITVTLLRTSVEICCTLSSHAFCTTPEESPHNKPAASSSPHFRALSRLYSSSLESEEEESPRTRKALESSISQGALHCAASVSASIPCRREPNHLDHCKGFRNGCSTIQPSAPSRVERRILAPGNPSRVTIQPDFAAWTIRTDSSEPVATPRTGRGA